MLMNEIRKEDYALYLAAMPGPVKEDLCRSLASQGVVTVEDTRGMVMMRAVDCFDTPFHLGEVLVRQVRVELNGSYGIGIAMGDSFTDAFIAAAAEVADAAVHEAIAKEIAGLMSSNAHWRRDVEAYDRGIATTTRVNFGLMVEG
jgi:phosphonate C-P lyase system protein PhnG